MAVSRTSAADRRVLGRPGRLPGRGFAASAAAVALAGALLYVAGFEQGPVALLDGVLIHEFVHDARHALGFPCH